MAKDKSQKKFMLPGDVQQMVELEAETTGRSQSEIAEEALRRHLGGGDKSELERELKEVQARKEQFRTELERREDKLADLERKTERIKRQMEQIEDGDVFDESDVEEAREILENGHRLFPNHDFVERMAEKHGLNAAKAHESLKTRLQGDFPERAFRLAKGAEDPNWRAAERDAEERAEA